MRYWVANTDIKWFNFLASIPSLKEANFWQPNRVRPVTLEHGAPWIFKLHVREGGWVVGGGYFAHYTTLTPRLAWEAFGEANGASTYEGFLDRLIRYSERPVDPLATQIGASVLVQPFFLPRDLWIPSPSDWSSNLTRGKTYETGEGTGRQLWDAITAARVQVAQVEHVAASELQQKGFGAPQLIKPRLGQGAFRVMVTDAYERRCVVTGERTLPVLEAAHIKPYHLVGRHELSNGLLLRSDLHTLFDLGYVTVSPPDLRLVVSRRIHEEFENGRDYYALDGRPLRMPQAHFPPPSDEMLDWHSQNVFRG